MRISIEVPDTKIANALCSAFASGGIAYWAHIESRSGSDRRPVWREPLQPTGWVRLALTPAAEERGIPRPLMLNRRSIAVGLRLMVEHTPKQLAAILNGDSDMNTGDVLVQFAVFGKLAYG